MLITNVKYNGMRNKFENLNHITFNVDGVPSIKWIKDQKVERNYNSNLILDNKKFKHVTPFSASTEMQIFDFLDHWIKENIQFYKHKDTGYIQSKEDWYHDYTVIYGEGNWFNKPVTEVTDKDKNKWMYNLTKI